jgi:hypothetical protein
LLIAPLAKTAHYLGPKASGKVARHLCKAQ